VSARCLVFVYGTLMQGEPGHPHLGHARLLGPWTTPARFRMVVVDWYPAIGEGACAIEGEVFEVSTSQLEALDAYEGDAYERELLTTPWGPAFVYVASELPADLPVVASGRWRDVALDHGQRVG
jgi:gamma-glutamylaminecyclotransferase